MRASAAPRVAPHQFRSTTLLSRGRVGLRVALRGMVSGRLLARRWPRTNMTQIGVRLKGLSDGSGWTKNRGPVTGSVYAACRRRSSGRPEAQRFR